MIASSLRWLLRVAVALPAILFVVMGLRWLVDPAGIAPELGLSLERGLGLSSQVADLSAFFLVLGLCILVALVTGRRSWYYPPVLLLLLAATGRIVAWAVHDAALATAPIGVELLVSVLLLAASRWLPDRP